MAVLAVGLLPGALYVWSFEGVVGRWGASLSDRVLHFIGASALLHAVAAPITYWLWSEYVYPGRLAGGDPLPIGLWFVVLAYALAPISLGWVVGHGTRRRWKWTQLLTGRNPAPRAWDAFFGDDPEGWVRLRLRSGAWIGAALGGRDGRRSYFAGYPEKQDLYLVQTAEVEQVSSSTTTRNSCECGTPEYCSGGTKSSTSSSSRDEEGGGNGDQEGTAG